MKLDVDGIIHVDLDLTRTHVEADVDRGVVGASLSDADVAVLGDVVGDVNAVTVGIVLADGNFLTNRLTFAHLNIWEVLWESQGRIYPQCP